MVQRGLSCAAAAVIVGVIGTALLQLAMLILSFPSPAAATMITLVVLVLLNSLRRRLRTYHRSRWTSSLRDRRLGLRIGTSGRSAADGRQASGAYGGPGGSPHQLRRNRPARSQAPANGPSGWSSASRMRPVIAASTAVRTSSGASPAADR
jgi:hypothetical protein